MRIAHVSATFPPYWAGTGNVCYHNARELASRGHEVVVLTAATPGLPADAVVEGVRVKRLPVALRVGNAPLLAGLPGALRGFDLVHLHYPFFFGETAALAARLKRTPLVITYHQDVLLRGAMGLIERALRNTVERFTLRAADRVLFTSSDYANFSHVRPLLRGREQTLGELPNGVAARRFTPGERPSYLRLRHSLATEDRVVLLVAALDRPHYFKGVDVLLQALARLPLNVRGLIVGEGDLRREYERRAEELGLASRVVFAGRVTNEELPDYYRLADVTVLPSTTMGEAFGLVLIESLACGVPVVASSIPGVRRVVDHGDDGLLATPGDPAALATAVAQVLADESERQAMGRRGRAKVEARYDWKVVGDRLEAIYRDLLGEERAHSRAIAGKGR